MKASVTIQQELVLGVVEKMSKQPQLALAVPFLGFPAATSGSSSSGWLQERPPSPLGNTWLMIQPFNGTWQSKIATRHGAGKKTEAQTDGQVHIFTNGCAKGFRQQICTHIFPTAFSIDRACAKVEMRCPLLRHVASVSQGPSFCGSPH